MSIEFLPQNMGCGIGSNYGVKSLFLTFEYKIHETDAQKDDTEKNACRSFVWSYVNHPKPKMEKEIFTELGWPASGRDDSGNMIYDDTAGINTAEYIARMLPLAYGVAYAELFAGAFYFEFSDEWWKSGNETKWNTTSTAIYVDSWPNKYADQEGYGLYSVKRGAGLRNDSPLWCGSGPCQPVDEMVPRPKLTDALSNIYKNLPQ